MYLNLKKLFFCFISLILINSVQANTTNKEIKTWYAILAPMTSESKQIEKEIAPLHIVVINHVNYHIGKYAGKNIVLVNSGIGLINSAAITSRLINDFHPVEIFLSGSSGSINSKLKIGDVIIAKQIFNADYGVLTVNGPKMVVDPNLNPQDNRPIPLIFNSEWDINKIITHLSPQLGFSVIAGRVADGDNLPNPPWQIALLKKNHVDVVAMEGAALMQTCWLFHTKCLVIRGVSNAADKPITDEGTLIAAKNAGDVTLKILQAR